MSQSVFSLVVLINFIFYFRIQGQVFNIIVAKDGSGDYNTLQDALNHVPDNATDRTWVFVKKGVYKEKVSMGTAKKMSVLLAKTLKG